MAHRFANHVALLAEGVDRNIVSVHSVLSPLVALLAEGVDRNKGWTKKIDLCGQVALLAEGVDRNKDPVLPGLLLHRRPPRGGRG